MVRIDRTCWAFLPLLATTLLATCPKLAGGQMATREGKWPADAAGQADVSGESTPSESDEPQLLVREGTHLREQRGHFEFTGDTAVFVDSEGRRFGGLKNLGMQRVVEALRAARKPGDLEWTVSGIVTEFSGRNYLLISRVVRRSAAANASDQRTRRSKRPEVRKRTAVDIGDSLPTMSSAGR